MGANIRDVELKENSINTPLIDDLLSHPILIKRRPHWGILKINCVLDLCALGFAHCIVICVVTGKLKYLRREAFASIPGFDMQTVPFNRFMSAAVHTVITIDTARNIWLPCLYFYRAASRSEALSGLLARSKC